MTVLDVASTWGQVSGCWLVDERTAKVGRGAVIGGATAAETGAAAVL